MHRKRFPRLTFSMGMTRGPSALVGFVAVMLVSETLVAEDVEVARVAAIIDSHIEARWSDDQIVAAPTADDAEFCRRAYLSLAGRIPHVSEISDFLEDVTSDKREQLVRSLVESNGYVNHFTTVWRKTLLPETATDFQSQFLIPGFEAWLRSKLVSSETRFDRLVYELVTSPLDDGRRQLGFARVNGLTPVAFFQAKQSKPENLAAATSRMFLGVRIECAQCHEHPFDNWTQIQFWQYAAFFSELQRRQAPNLLSQLRGAFQPAGITIPDTDTVAQATYLDGSQPELDTGLPARTALAKWITSPGNPYFARATANRLWGYLFGVGLVDPIDDFSQGNAATHPELLDDLARELIEHDYDLKFMFRAIMASQTYQRSSRQTHPSQADPRTYARFGPQPLSAEQLVDSLRIATGGGPAANVRNPLLNNTPRSELILLFADETAAASDRSATILQALAMMNSRLIADATDASIGATLGAIVEAPWMEVADQIELLYLATLSRRPNDEELARWSDTRANPSPATAGATDAGRRLALGDLLWVLLNSSEFMMNH